MVAASVGDHVRLAPLSHYGAFKVCNELNARVYWLDHGIPSIGLRPWTVYGVGRDFGMTSEPTKAIKSVAVGRPYHISYGGKQDLQYVADVAATFVRALTQPFQGADAFNMRGAVEPIERFVAAFCEAVPEARPLLVPRRSPATDRSVARRQPPREHARPDQPNAAPRRNRRDISPLCRSGTAVSLIYPTFKKTVEEQVGINRTLVSTLPRGNLVPDAPRCVLAPLPLARRRSQEGQIVRTRRAGRESAEVVPSVKNPARLSPTPG